jgi:hypothetical protein
LGVNSFRSGGGLLPADLVLGVVPFWLMLLRLGVGL